MGLLHDFWSAVARTLESEPTGGFRGEAMSRSEFESVVHAVAADHSWRIAGVRFTGPTSVEVQFLSQSRKSTWPAHFEFDPDTGYCTYRATYRDANEPKFFIEEVQGRVTGW